MRGLRENWWVFLALAGFLGYLEPLPSWLRLLNLLFLWPLLRALFRRERQPEGEKVPEAPLPPAADGKVLFWGRFTASMILLFLWPPALAGQLLQFLGGRRAAPRALESVSSYQQKARYSLPFSGEWYVLNGGPDEGSSHSWDVVAHRYAYDFVVADGALRRWREEAEGRELGDYLCYGEPILAPSNGVVVAAEDGIRDAPRPGTGWADPFARHIAGNHVVIEHAEGEYSFLGHLIPGSIPVNEGERVSLGQEVGRWGNSGNSSEPHLHFQVQVRANFFEAVGLPVAFDSVSVDGNEPVPNRYLQRSTRVRRA